MDVPKLGLESDKYIFSNQGVSGYFWRFNFWVISILSVCVIVACAWFIDSNNNDAFLQKKRTEVQNQLSILRTHLDSQLNANIQAVNGLIAAISIEPDMDQTRFNLFAKQLLEKRNQLRNIAGAPNMVISLMYPMKGNEAAIGLNYLTNEQQRAAALIARDTGQLVLAGPVKLVQGGEGFIGRIPVFTDTANNKREFWGLVSAVIDSHELYRASGLLDPELEIDIAIYGYDKRFSDGSIFYGKQDIFTLHPVVSFIELPYGSWQLAARPKTGWPEQAENAWQLRLIMFLIGVFIITSVISLAWLSNRHREQQIRLNALFQLSPMGIALNDYKTGQYIYINQQFSKDTGYSLQEIQDRSYWDLTPEKYKDSETEQLLNLKKHGRYGPYEKEYINAQGQTYPVLLNGVLIKDSSGDEYIWSYIQNITNEKQSKNLLYEKNKQLELVIKSTQVGIWDWHIQSGKLDLNERWAQIIGYTLAELGEISIETWLTHSHPDDLEASGNLLEKYWNGKVDHYTFEGRMRHKQGHDIWVLDHGRVIEWDENGKPKRMVGTHLDITEKKRSEQKIAQTNKSLSDQIKLIKTIVNTQSDFIKNYDPDLAIKNLLRNFMSLSSSNLAFIADVIYQDGLPHIEIKNNKWLIINRDEDECTKIDSIKDIIINNRNNVFLKSAISLTHYISNNPSEDEILNSFQNPTYKINNYISIPVTMNSKPKAIICLANCEDNYSETLIKWLTPLINTVGQIIEGMEYIEEKRKVQKELINAKNEAEAAGNAKTEFLATMSHEIRTPMNGVLGMLNLLLKSQLTSEQIRKVNIAKTSADSLLVIINDILDFTKFESGKLKLEKIEFNLRELIDSICQSMAFRSQEKKLELIIDSSELKHDNIISDPVRIRQILTNLIGNANKFTEKGDIIVKTSTREIEGSIILRCDISDTGIGISKDKISLLFNSFTQADASTTRRFGGTGLGLSICKRICDFMGGNIWVTSKENTGSCFSFEVPVMQSNTPLEINLPDNIKKVRILILDDNEKSNNAITKQLQAWGMTVNCAVSTSEAGDLLNSETHYDIIFINHLLNHSQISGIEFGRHIRKTYPHFKSRLALMTPVNQVQSDTDIYEAGFNAHFSKPVITKDYMMCLNSLTHNSNIPEDIHTPSEVVKTLPENTKLLLVEDIPFNQEVAIMLLAEMGVSAEVANNGQEAVDKVKASLDQGDPYDAILMDCQMPVMDGYQATAEIRELEAHTDHVSRIIAMTANAMSEDKQKCLDAGMDDYLSKPIEEDRLFNTLLKWIAK